MFHFHLAFDVKNRYSCAVIVGLIVVSYILLLLRSCRAVVVTSFIELISYFVLINIATAFALIILIHPLSQAHALSQRTSETIMGVSSSVPLDPAFQTIASCKRNCD